MASVGSVSRSTASAGRPAGSTERGVSSEGGFVGPCEEILYRGVVQGRLRESLPAAPAIVIASAVFAVIHVMALTGGISGRLTTVAVLFFPSLVFGAVYEYTGNIVVPALLHSLHNAVIFTLLYASIAYADELGGAAEGGAVLLPV